MRQLRQTFVYMIAAVVLITAMTVTSCSTRKNTAATRHYQAFITKYNIYYNGDTHFRNTLQDMENNYEDDYSQLLFMHPVEAKSISTAPQPQGDFTRCIEKGQKAIQLRSIKRRPAKKGGRLTPEQKEWYKRDEYNPFLHNAWMLMAKGQYYNGDFAGAASTFFYVSRHFKWLPATVAEAELWQARSYVSMDWLFEAEVILNRYKPDSIHDKQLRGLYDFVRADFHIKSGQYEEAVPYLRGAINVAKGAQKTRLRFLLGQIYTRLGRREEADQAFRAAGSSSSASYRTKFNARIRRSEVYTGEDITPEVKALRRMLRYDRNKEYLDQIYYAIGNLYLSRGDTTQAIDNYVLAAEKSTRNGIDKAINQLRLGGLYFDRRQYDLAQPCYAEAVPQLPENYPDYRNIKRRSDVLDELAVYSQNVTLQDSLLRLAEMTPEQRMEIINRIIEELRRAEAEAEEAARRAEYDAQQQAQGQPANQGIANAPNSFTINTDDSWYFYNSAARNAGKTEFQRRWGARKLEDNWRRRNKTQFNVDEFNNTDDEEEDVADVESPADTTDIAPEDAEAAARASDPHYPEYYLAQIPETEEQKATAHEIIQEGLYNMGVILKDKLEDYNAARGQFARLLNDYPDNVYRLDTYYNLYLMYMRENKRNEAETYRLLILSNFSDSPIGAALQNPDYIDNLRNMDSEVQRLYEATYEAYLANDNATVHSAYQTMTEKYPMSKVMPKFMFLNALAYVTERRTDDFNATLRLLLERYPETDITPIASAWLKGMAQGRQIHSGSSNMRGMIWDQRLGNDSTAVAEGEAAFSLKPDSKQLLVMTFAIDQVSSNALLYEIARHNFKSFVVKAYELEQLNFGRLGMIVISTFDNIDEVDHYCRVMAASSDFKLPVGVRPVVISDENFKILLNQGRSFDEYFRFLQEQNYVSTQEQLLQPEEVETLDEADTAPQTQAAEPQATEPQAETPAEATPAPTNPPTPPATAPATPTTTPAPTSTPATPAATPAPAPVIVPTPTRPNMPTYDPGSEGDDPLLE